MQLLGLREGDIVYKIGKVSIAGKDKLYSAFKKIRDEKKVTVKVWRNGLPFDIHLSIR